MMAFTEDGQLDPALIAARDSRYGVNSADKKESRKELSYPQVTDPAADHWKSGTAWQVSMEQVEFSAAKQSAKDREP
jgi:hypothetical protein